MKIDHMLVASNLLATFMKQPTFLENYVLTDQK